MARNQTPATIALESDCYRAPIDKAQIEIDQSRFGQVAPRRAKRKSVLSGALAMGMWLQSQVRPELQTEELQTRDDILGDLI